jgi:hypothetical protein
VDVTNPSDILMCPDEIAVLAQFQSVSLDLHDRVTITMLHLSADFVIEEARETLLQGQLQPQGYWEHHGPFAAAPPPEYLDEERSDSGPLSQPGLMMLIEAIV